MATEHFNVTSNWTEPPWKINSTGKGCLVLGTNIGRYIPQDNPNNIISQDVEQAVDTAVGTVCLPILFLISAPSNILNMLVFWKQGLKERINLCLFYLSLVDCLHMFHAFFLNVDRFYLPHNTAGEVGPVFQFLVEHRLVGFRTLNWLSGFVSMLIACERCLCVISPLRSQTILGTRTTAFILAFFTIFNVTCSLLIGMRLSLACVFDPQSNRISKKVITSQFFARNRSHLYALSFFCGGIQPVVYVTVIVVTTIMTSVKLKAMVAWREQSSTQTLSWREMALTRMLIATSVLYIICALPSTMAGIGLLFLPVENFTGRYYHLGLLFITLMELTSYINASFNFFVYISIGSKFRSTLQTLFHCFTPIAASQSKEASVGMD